MAGIGVCSKEQHTGGGQASLIHAGESIGGCMCVYTCMRVTAGGLAGQASFMQVSTPYVLHLQEAIALGGWGVIRHWVIHHRALVLLYYPSHSQSHPTTITHITHNKHLSNHLILPRAVSGWETLYEEALSRVAQREQQWVGGLGMCVYVYVFMYLP